MSFIDKLEKRFGRFAIKNLTVYILIAYAIGYLTNAVNPVFYEYLTMQPEMIFKGQVWRLFTWICTMPQELNFFILFMFFFFYWVGSNLERVWGSFKYNIFIFSGYLFMTIGSIAIYAITYFVGPSSEVGMGINVNISTYYINLTSFLAFATLFGDAIVYIMGLIPIKVKWLAILDLLLIVYDMIYMGSTMKQALGEYYYGIVSETVWCYRIMVILSLCNFLLFYLIMKKTKGLSPKARQTRKEFKKKVNKITPVNTVHICSVCGRTSETNPELSFRYCSKCNGSYEYCNEHLFTHQHR